MTSKKRRRISLSLLWDGLMVYLAIVNVLFIGFDFSYLWFRSFYVNNIPWVARHYDRVKGIEPHPTTSRYIELVDETRELVEQRATPDQVGPGLEELRQLSLELLNDPVFFFHDVDVSMAAIRFWVVTQMGYPPAAAAHRASVEEAFVRLWSYHPNELSSRLDFFDEKLRPIMAPNYFREFDPDSGKLVDHSWLIDLPFLCLFALEFLVRWGLAVRRHTYRTWYLFPLYNWYDALGLIPYFRLFRLFRIVSIYVRLYRSELTVIGQDVISRTVKFVSRAIAEEITDMVTIRILDQTQAKLRGGIYTEIIHDELNAHREAIRSGLVQSLSDVATNSDLRERVREFLRINLEQSVNSAPALRGVPLPDALLRPLVTAVGNAVFDSFVQTVADTLREEHGKQVLRQVVDGALDTVLAEVGGAGVEELIQRIALEMIERTKQSVAVRQWENEAGRESSRGDPRHRGP
jgi:hypothetical protein